MIGDVQPRTVNISRNAGKPALHLNGITTLNRLISHGKQAPGCCQVAIGFHVRVSQADIQNLVQGKKTGPGLSIGSLNAILPETPEY